AMAGALGTRYAEVTFVGGGAKSPLWGQITSDVMGLPIVTTNTVESSALGAAMIGFTAMGAYPSIQEATGNMTRHEVKFRPDRKNIPAYDRLFEVYKELFPAVREQMHRLNEVVQGIEDEGAGRKTT
ncbi:MAG: FGGY-family carbohydrate kinase, partial [Spirochaetota bacterium]